MKTSAAKAPRLTPRTAIERVLQAFPPDGRCLTRVRLRATTGLSDAYITRKVRLLLDDGLIHSHVRGCWKLTPDGEQLRAAMGDGAQGVGRSGRGGAGGTPSFCDRLWNALRIEKKGGVADFLRLAANADDKRPTMKAYRFIADLERHGIVARVQKRRPPRFALIRDVGPRRPHFLDGRLYDPNMRRFLEERA